MKLHPHRSFRVAAALFAVSLVTVVFSSGVARASDGKDDAHARPPEKKQLPSPSPDLNPDQVIRIQMEALQHNDDKNSGIALTFEFASPENKKSTGPLDHFIDIVKGPAYAAMINAKAISYGELKVNGDEAYQPVTVTAADGKRSIFVFGLSKQTEGAVKGCWMTDSVVRMERNENDPLPGTGGDPPVKT